MRSGSNYIKYIKHPVNVAAWLRVLCMQSRGSLLVQIRCFTTFCPILVEIFKLKDHSADSPINFPPPLIFDYGPWKLLTHNLRVILC